MRSITENAMVAWRSGWRSQGARLIFVLGLFLVAAAWLAGAFSLRQPMIVVLDVGLSGLRLLAVLLGLFWVQEMLAKDIERRTILVSLAYPLSRGSYLLGRYLGIACLVLFAVVGFGLLLLLAVYGGSWNYAGTSRPVLGLAYWLALAGIYLDVLIVTAFAMWLATLSETPFLPLMVGLAFAIGGRALGPVIEYLRFSPYAEKSQTEHILPWLDSISWILPDLSRLDWRIVTLYGADLAAGTVPAALALTLGYIGLALILAFLQFSRREFK